jgi:hypothetical protein
MPSYKATVHHEGRFGRFYVARLVDFDCEATGLTADEALDHLSMHVRAIIDEERRKYPSFDVPQPSDASLA